MTAREMIIKYLKDNDYDGLCSDNCGCWISDLAPCSNYVLECVPGKETELTDVHTKGKYPGIVEVDEKTK